MDFLTKWLEAYTIHNQESWTMAAALVTDFFWRFGVPWGIHSDQGHNFESRLQHLGMSKTRTTTLHPQSDGIEERYIKTVKEHLRKIGVTQKRDWGERLPIFLLSYWASTHDTMGLTPARLVFGRELRLPCDLLFGAPPNKERPHNQSRGKFSGPPTFWRPQLCPPIPEACPWPDEDSLWQTGEIRGLWQWRKNVAVSPKHHEGEIAQAPIFIGGPI
jgi:hypothetical protein